MRKHPRSSRSSLQKAAPLALLLTVSALPSPAVAQLDVDIEIDANFVDIQFIFNLAREASTASKLVEFAGSVQSGVSAAQSVLTMIGVLESPMTTDELFNEMLKIAAYQDRQTKLLKIVDIDTHLQNARGIMTQRRVDPEGDVFAGIVPEYQADLYLQSLSAVTQALDPENLCTIHPLFQTLDWDSGRQGLGSEATYDWRIGLARGLNVVATRLMALAMLDPNFMQNISVYASELNGIRDCLIRHRNLISPPKPFTFCEPNWGCAGGPNGGGCGCDRLDCYDHRSWPVWYTKHSSIGFSRCMDFVDGIHFCSNLPNVCDDPRAPSYASHVEFEDLRAAATAKIERNNLPILFPLQKMIDTLGLLTSGRPDLAQTTQRIPLQANPQLCLSAGGGSWQGIEVPSLQNCSAGASVAWTYDRESGRVRNVANGRCLTVRNPGEPVGYDTCTSAVDESAQVWNWNIETKKLKNMRGTVLTVASNASEGAIVTADYEHLWKLHQQTWADGTSSTCSGAVCPAPGPLAWNQGYVDEQQTVRYPIDFNVFTYMRATGLSHVGGPVAANGTAYPTAANGTRITLGGIAASNFFINESSGMGTAIVQGGGILSLSNGTVMNAIRLDPQAIQSPAINYTFLGWDRHVYTQPSPINFEMALVKLQDMSRDLPIAPTGTTTVKWNNTIELKATHPSDNPQVFAIPTSVLSPTNLITSIQLVDVPDTATVVINVGGDDPVIRYAGLPGFPFHGRVIWNFRDAKRLRVISVGLVGSILAPYADVQLTSGFVTGTVASWSVMSKWGAEFHQGQFRNNAIVTGP